MRGFRGDNWRSPIYANNVNITNVNNITNVTQISTYVNGYGRTRGKRGKRMGKGDGRNDRPPKLFRYCASCGILDQDVASSMSTGRMCDESVKSLSYTAKGLSSSIGGMAKGVSRMGNGVAEMAMGVFGFIGALIRGGE